MDRLIMFVATGAGSGYLPKAPGTWGSLLGVGLWFFLRNLSLFPYLAVVAVLFALGIVCAGSAEKIMDAPDPGLVVIDEVVGQLLTLSMAPNYPVAPLFAFVLFRLFDILKPFPVGWLDHHIHGGLGIMLDDIIAGLYALAVLQIGYLVYGS